MTQAEYHALREKYQALLRQMDARHLIDDEWKALANQTREMEKELHTYERLARTRHMERMF